MKITDLLTKEAIDLNVKATNKKDVIEKAVELMQYNGNINNKEEYLKLVMKREEEGSTGVGNSHTTWKRRKYIRTRTCSNGNTRRSRF